MEPSANKSLNQNLSSSALDILKKDKPDFGHILNELRFTTLIDAAHTLMLRERKLVSNEICDKLLRLQYELLTGNKLKDIAKSPSPRGLYIAYEDYLIEHLGIEIGGTVHFGRSRNDINATIFKLELRDQIKEICRTILSTREVLINRAKHFYKTPFIIYSQYQPALPGTFGFYLAGLEVSLSRQYKSISNIFYDLAECPLGAGAGGGTELAIDIELTAYYLGFKRPLRNALDAVASRDIAISLLSALTNISVLISRIAQDFQIWTTQESSIIKLPDDLIGTSSMLPQKRNPYLLEKIKGKASRVFSSLTSTVVAMQKTPFSNSVEVGTESLFDLNKGITDFQGALGLTNLLIESVNIDTENVSKLATQGAIYATNAANKLVLDKGLSYKEAYQIVAGCIRGSSDTNKSNGISKLLDEKNMASPINDLALNQKYGSGPGAYLSESPFKSAEEILNEDLTLLNSQAQHWHEAEKVMMKKIYNILN